jgi:hypothetical protein
MIHRKVTVATIARPIDEVYDWVTTPGYWPLFWTVTQWVECDDPWQRFRVGTGCREHANIGGWIGHFDWTCEVEERPHRCVITAVSSGDTLLSKLPGSATGRIEYTLTSDGTSTQLTRDMSYPVHGILAHLGDLAGFGRTLDAACETARTTMVSMLENPLLTGPRPDPTSESLLHEADPLADEAVASLVPASGDTTALMAFLTALHSGDPSTPVPEGPMRRFLEATVDLPAWACEPRLTAASEVFLEWGVLNFAAHVCASLPETYYFPRTAKLLDMTRQLDANATHVDRRLWFTLRMVFDIFAEGAWAPGGRARLALQRLRLLHALVRLFATHKLESPHRLSGLSSTGIWDTENGQPISQLELLHTLLTFSHVTVRSFNAFGCNLTPYQREAYIHTWNVAGALLGIRPELLPRDSADAALMFEAIKQRYGAATPESARLGTALTEFWTNAMPPLVRAEALPMMQYVVSTLISKETAAANGLDHLPAFPEAAMHAIERVEGISTRLLSHVFGNVPDARRAAATLVSLLVRRRTDVAEGESGAFDIPEHLYDRWRGEKA